MIQRKLIKRMLFHFLFWTLGGAFLMLYFGEKSQDSAEVLPYVAILMPAAIITSYLFNYRLISYYLPERKWVQLILFGFCLFIASLYVELLIIVVVFIFIAKYEIHNMLPGITNIMHVGVGVYFLVFLNSIIYLARRWETMKEQSEELVITIRADRMNRIIKEDNLLYVESMDNYVKVHLINEQLITKERISHLEKVLSDSFIRIHRSFLINKDKIESYTKDHVVISGEKIPISRTYKNNLLALLNE